MSYASGDYHIICDRCGFKVLRSQARKTWDGLIVCRKDWEPRHPQDFVKARSDRQAVRDPRPEQTDSFISTAITQDDL